MIRILSLYCYFCLKNIKERSAFVKNIRFSCIVDFTLYSYQDFKVNGYIQSILNEIAKILKKIIRY